MAYRGVDCPPKFDGLNFPIWKVWWPLLWTLGSRVAKAIFKHFVKPDGDENTWSETTRKEHEANIKAKYALIQALNDDDLSRVINCTSAYD